MKVSRRWIEWAHEPAAESGNKAALVLCEMSEAPGRGNIEVNEPRLLRELLSVAECYGPGSATDDMGPWWKAERNRIVREARAALR